MLEKNIFIVAAGFFILGCQPEKIATQEAAVAENAAIVSRRAVENQILVSGGTFVMGDFGTVDDEGKWRAYFPRTADIELAHEVTLSDYSLARYETTWFDFDTFLLATGRPVVFSVQGRDIPRQPYNESVDDWRYLTHPALVTWQQAKDYCAWLAEETGLGFDLPSSAQWEFAARNRGSKEWVHPTPDGKPFDGTNAFLESSIGPVGSRLPPNPLGLYDMADNAEEWVNDWYSETYYGESDGATDPAGPAEGEGRVLRSLGGGPWSFSFSHRIGKEGLSDGPPPIAGFRCAIDEPEGEAS